MLAIKRLDSAKHSGVISLFNREFVKPGLISKEASTNLSTLFNLRAEADYDDFNSFTLEGDRETPLTARRGPDRILS